MNEFGLIGKTLGHSFSAGYFAKKFEKLQLKNYSYQNFELDSISQLPALLAAHPFLVGLNVTIPYKEQILPFLQRLTPEAKQIGAVNTVFIRKFSSPNQSPLLIGHNTDVAGFELTLKPHLNQQLKQHTAVVFGSGGASKAVSYVLAKAGIDFVIASRNPIGAQVSYEEVNALNFELPRLFINTTPLGMSPFTTDVPPIDLYSLGRQHVVIDLIYNPEETLLLQEAKKRGAITQNGLVMLHGQAEASWNFWTSSSR